MTSMRIPANPIAGDSYDLAQLEEMAIKNLQQLLYQADLDLLKNWLPIICSAIKTGKLGETVLMGYGYYAVGDHDSLKSSLRSLEAQFPDEFRRELINFESNLLRIRYEFSYGNFAKIEEIYKNLPTIEEYPFKRANDFHFSKHRACLTSAFYLQDKEKFEIHYEAIEKYLTQEFGTIEHLNANSFKSMRAFMDGNYILANEYALASLKVADELNVNGAYLPFESAYILADTYLEFGEVNKSREISDKYLNLALEFNQYPWITAFYAKSAIIKLQEANVNGALALLRKGREVIDNPLYNSTLSFPLDIHEIIIRLQMGDFERIYEILHRLPDVQTVRTFKLMLEFMKNPSMGKSLIESFPVKTDQDKLRRESFLVLLNLKNPPEAKKYLRNAIDIAVPNGYFRSFLSLPAEAQSLILDIASESPTVYLEKLSRAILNQSSAAAKNSMSSITPLTKRELDVLRRLGTNLPITKIAASLHISNNTIKTHLKNMYRKLNVDSRDEAVARGKELSLL